jgi:hypothetical protein
MGLSRWISSLLFGVTSLDPTHIRGIGADRIRGGADRELHPRSPGLVSAPYGSAPRGLTTKRANNILRDQIITYFFHGTCSGLFSTVRRGGKLMRRNVLSLIVFTVLVTSAPVASYAQQAYQFGK